MILITGASRGIGRFLMESFLQEGLNVKGTYFKSEPQGDLSKYLTKVNVKDNNSVNAWIDSLSKELTEVVLLNCAGSNYNSFGHKADAIKWKDVIDTNLVGVFNVINKVLPFMREQNYGRIINFSSIVAQIGIPGTSAYAASKSALWGMSKALAIENASKGITINNLNLGYFDIGMINDVPKNMLEVIQQKIPTGQLGKPQNIFETVKYLISCEYINGTSIDINGGLF